jgi:hypothetical protein
MKKTVLLLVFSTGFVFSVFAQSARFGIFNLGVYGAVPLSNIKPLLNEGVGGSLKYECNLFYDIPSLRKSYVSNKLYVTLESGYEAFGVKTKLQNAYVPSTYSYVPVKAGLKFYPIWGFYAEAQEGVVQYAQHGGGHAPDFSTGIGYSFKPGFEFGIRFEQWKQTPQNHITGDYGQTGPFAKTSNFGQLALRLAERF